jgi:cell division protein FtsQ
MIKRILIITGWVVLVAGATVLLGFAKSKRGNTACKGVDIQIAENDGNLFITSDEIRALITKDQGEIMGKAMNKINLLEVEQLLKDNPYITNALVYATLDGTIKIKVAQKSPMVRIVNENDESYYIDTAGYFMPLTDNSTPRVLVANGIFADSYAVNFKNNARKMQNDTSVHSVLSSIYKLAAFITKDPFWKAQITEVYVDSLKEFTLIPRVGCQKILFGDTSDLKPKFDRLFILYKDGFNSNGKWNEYATINLKYKHQIICTKK